MKEEEMYRSELPNHNDIENLSSIVLQVKQYPII